MAEHLIREELEAGLAHILESPRLCSSTVRAVSPCVCVASTREWCAMVLFQWAIR